MHSHRFLYAVILAASALSVLTVMLITSLCAQSRAVREAYQEDISINEMVDADDGDRTDRLKRAA
ncbi:hypothetical protein SAMN03159496_06101 [Rhizobium sp. NFR07]|uniref:hypothetical protein n=1 Tax=Rhizobium sp. NFR07 TaxID=1566262 RepID=UPI0008E5AE2C|nr:hypothetical protein [Rhizobium sp. NFR07]SFB62876.1 hypothetical protein SAMN03159496_06101 [Rhizobium sp. NFR07]